jgi:hypothetical protein
VRAVQVQPRNQFLDALGLSQVRRKNLQAERLRFVGRPTIPHPRLLHHDRTDSGGDCSLRQETVADHLASSVLVAKVLMLGSPVVHILSDHLGQHLLSACPKNLRHTIATPGHRRRPRSNVLLAFSAAWRLALRDWCGEPIYDTLMRYSVLLGLGVVCKSLFPKVRRLFQSSLNTTFGYISIA